MKGRRIGRATCGSPTGAAGTGNLIEIVRSITVHVELDAMTTFYFWRRLDTETQHIPWADFRHFRDVRGSPSRLFNFLRFRLTAILMKYELLHFFRTLWYYHKLLALTTQGSRMTDGKHA